MSKSTMIPVIGTLVVGVLCFAVGWTVGYSLGQLDAYHETVGAGNSEQ